MSEISDGNTCIPSLHQETKPALSDLSHRDKPWDKHRSNADRVTSHYAGSEFQSYSERVNFCAQMLDFRLVPDESKGAYSLKLSSARFCRVRHCPVCQWRRSLMWKAKAYKILPKIVEDYPNHRWLFITLTVKNCKVSELRDTLSLMNKGFKRMTELKKFPAIGWLKSMEVTRGKDQSAHPHFHCLMLVKPGYFGKNYLKQADWADMWQKSMRLEYTPVIDVRTVKKGQQPMQLVPELLKYCVKESDLVNDRGWFLELTKQLHKTRAIATGGVLKDYLKALEEEPEDLIGKDNNDVTRVDEGHLYFGWKPLEKKYRMIDNG